MGTGLSARGRTVALAAGAAVSGVLAVVLAAAGRPGGASGAAGALLALGIAAGTAWAAQRAHARSPQAGFKVSVLGVAVRMALVGIGLAAAISFPWFRAVPFVATFGTLYLLSGIWLTVQQNRDLASAHAPGAGGGGEEKGVHAV